ncbi:glycosyltransferase family 4 protein [Quadrisphaera sp. KR29]|uniref:glycosyltransferase family 4 protein n=1 Tax=Quadrisphaera sp. KR29 TaxID=3461391 RepID=UPI004045190C
MSWLVDGRATGHHGIARFSREVVSRLTGPVEVLTSTRVAPLSPLDPAWLSWQAARRRPGLLFSPGPYAALRTPCPQVLTVHDLIHLEDPRQASPARRAYYEALVFPAVRRAGRVLTVSEHSRRRLLERLRLPEEEVVVVGNGLSPGLAAPAPAPARAGERPHLLFVGNAKPYKRLDTALAVARELAATHDLVVVGVDRRALDAELLAAAPPSVQWRSGLAEAEVAALYAGATCLLFPSEHEGFGLPALEAMAQGTPTAYRCEAVGEVVGPLGLRVAEEDGVAGWCDAVLRAQAGEVSSTALRERAATFSWDEVARRVEGVLREVAP